MRAAARAVIGLVAISDDESPHCPNLRFFAGEMTLLTPTNCEGRTMPGLALHLKKQHVAAMTTMTMMGLELNHRLEIFSEQLVDCLVDFAWQSRDKVGR